MFEIVLFGLSVLTGLVVAWNKYLRPVPVTDAGGASVPVPVAERHEPWYVEYSRSFFPVLLIVFLLRSFIVEPFRIPSGSMLPTLQVGDFILVSKFHYGLRLPIVHQKVIDIGAPNRGDVMVFRFPGDNKTNYIKRVVGLPGDRIEYRDKRIFVNGVQVAVEKNGVYDFKSGRGQSITADRFTEQLGDVEHEMMINNGSRSRNLATVVPEGEYFVMGDNRDHSNDSRYWGFVPGANIVGKAFLIWLSWDSANGGGVAFDRIGNSL
jgi:signal peptidase I